MNVLWKIGVGLVIGAASWPAAAQNSVTIYNDGRALIRRTVVMRVPAGVSVQRVQLGNFDVGSLFALDSGVAVHGVFRDEARTEEATLRRMIGREINFLFRLDGSGGGALVQANREPVTKATLVALSPERWRLPNGLVTFVRPGIPIFPDEIFASEGAAVTLGADRARSKLGLGYFTTTGGWSASYTVLLGKTSARVSGVAVLHALGFHLDSAEVQLLAGDVGRAIPPAQRGMVPEVAMAKAADLAAQEQAVGEVHLYTLPGKFTLRPGSDLMASLFEPTTTPFEKTYTVEGNLPYWGGIPEEPQQQFEVPVAVTYLLKRGSKNGFGAKPLPAGTVRVYEADDGGRPQLVGEGNIDHTAAGQDARIRSGTAFDITARRVQTSYGSSRENRRTVAVAEYEVTLINAKSVPITVDVLERRAGEWSVVSSSVPAEKVSSTLTRFRVQVPANGEATLKYKVRVVW